MTLTDPDGGVRTYTYHPDGQTSLYQRTDGNIISLQYDQAGQQTTMTYPSGYKRLTTFDAAGQILIRAGLDAVNADLYRFTYTYDPAGNRKSIGDANGSDTTYTYDAKDRLTKDETSGTNAHIYNYRYDGNDNRLTSDESGTLTSYTYDADSRLVTSVAGDLTTTYIYDVNGNLSLVDEPTGSTSMVYDSENRLTRHVSGGSTATYLYMADGLKRIENKNSVLTTLVWDGSDPAPARRYSSWYWILNKNDLGKDAWLHYGKEGEDLIITPPNAKEPVIAWYANPILSFDKKDAYHLRRYDGPESK
jgi:YD repeat-containing protein